MRTSSRGRVRVSIGSCLFSVTVMLAAVAAIDVGAQSAGKGTQRPAAAAAQPPAPLPQVAATAIRVVGLGLGANGSELRPFNESPGTVVALAIQAPKGSGIVDIDTRASKVDAFSDDKGQSLLEEGRIGSFPKIAEDGTAAIVEVEVRARPAAGSASVTVQGSVAMTLAGGSKPVRATGVKLVAEQSFKVGTAMMSIGEVKVEEESTKVTLNLARSVMATIREVRFLDAKNGPIESRRTSSGYFNEKAQMEFDAKTKEKVVTVEFELWQNLRVVKVPFNVAAGLGVAAGPRTSGSAEAPAGAKPPVAAKPEGPPPAITKGDGADSVEAVVKQLQSAALASKGAQLLAVIYPTDRGTYGQGIAMALAFLPMATMDNEKATEQTQKELDAFFAKHQIKPPFMREPEELFKGVDLPAFVSGALTFLKGKAKKGDKPEEMLPIPQGRPENVSITGDSATATLSGKEVKFARISGRWFIRLE